MWHCRLSPDWNWQKSKHRTNILKIKNSTEECDQYTPGEITWCFHRSQKFGLSKRKLEITCHKENPMDRFTVRSHMEETLTAFCRKQIYRSKRRSRNRTLMGRVFQKMKKWRRQIKSARHIVSTSACIRLLTNLTV